MYDIIIIHHPRSYSIITKGHTGFHTLLDPFSIFVPNPSLKAARSNSRTDLALGGKTKPSTMSWLMATASLQLEKSEKRFVDDIF